MVQEKTTFLSVLYVGLHKEFTGCFYWREQPQKENREDETLPIW